VNFIINLKPKGLFMIKLRFVLAITALVFTIVNAQTMPVAADTAMKTVTSGKFVFSYRIDGANLVAKLACPTTGWLSVGFNPKLAMKNGFFIIGAAVDGKPVVSEDFGTEMFAHKSITSLGGANVLVAGDCSYVNGVATLTFTMPLSAKDGMHADLAAGKKVKLLFATGDSGDMTKKHRKKAVKTVNL
jgi:hypothetical protein